MKDYEDKIWVTRDGVRLHVTDMTTKHLNASFFYMERRLVTCASELMRLQKEYAAQPTEQAKRRYAAQRWKRKLDLMDRGRWCIRWMTVLAEELQRRGEMHGDQLQLAIDRVRISCRDELREAAV